MKYCSHCGSSVDYRIPPDDDRHRHVCMDCGTIHYTNPRIIAGCLPVCGDQVLICKRSIEPRKGYWTLPAGFMENGETTEEAAMRETWEEARADVVVDGLYAIFNLPHINQVYMFYRAHLDEPVFEPGPESEETMLCSEAGIPWDELAFPTVKKALQYYFEDRKSDHYPVRVRDIRFPPKR